MNLSTLFLKTTFVSALLATNLFANQADIEMKMSTLQKSIDDATAKGIDAEREKMTLHVAETFKTFIKWDTENIDEVQEAFNGMQAFKKNAKQYAKKLPDFEKEKVCLILDEAIDTLDKVKKGEIVRPNTHEPIASKVTLQGNKLIQDNRPIFLYDYIWKGSDKYFGDTDGILINFATINDLKATVSSGFKNNIQKKNNDRIGYVFMNHKAVPNWATDNEIRIGERHYTSYDIDNPYVREMFKSMSKGVVPLLKDKRYSQLGYMLTNEPHWYTAKDTWATGEVSKHTKENFRKYLEAKHKKIYTLNRIWGSKFNKFDKIDIEIPIDKSLQGTPIWQDWVMFNSIRVTEWFTFMHDEIKKYDPNMKSHIKVIPSMWTSGARDHGLDFEKLAQLTEIIGHDAGSYIHIYKKGVPTKDYEDCYSYEWRSSSMSADFFESVSPNKLTYNTESHFLSKVAAREWDLDKNYVRLNFFLTALTGTDAHQIWVWGRNKDGSINKSVGVPTQQPHVLNEIELTQMDLNSVAEHIYKLQENNRPIRIFYSDVNAINDPDYMDKIFSMYEKLYFEGVNIGFATQTILEEIDIEKAPVVIVVDTPTLSLSQLNSIKSYASKGGIVLTDDVSLKFDEYNKKHKGKISSENIKIVDSKENIKKQAFEILAKTDNLPILDITQSNDFNRNLCYATSYKNEDGKIYLGLANIANGKNKLNIKLRNSNKKPNIKNVFTGEKLSENIQLDKYGTLFLEITEK